MRFYNILRHMWFVAPLEYYFCHNFAWKENGLSSLLVCFNRFSSLLKNPILVNRVLWEFLVERILFEFPFLLQWSSTPGVYLRMGVAALIRAHMGPLFTHPRPWIMRGPCMSSIQFRIGPTIGLNVQFLLIFMYLLRLFFISFFLFLCVHSIQRFDSFEIVSNQPVWMTFKGFLLFKCNEGPHVGPTRVTAPTLNIYLGCIRYLLYK